MQAGNRSFTWNNPCGDDTRDSCGKRESASDDMLKSKKNLANLTFASGEKWIGELSNYELKEVFG